MIAHVACPLWTEYPNRDAFDDLLFRAAMEFVAHMRIVIKARRGIWPAI